MKGAFVRVLVFGILLSGWPVVGLAQESGDYEVEPKVVRVPISEVVGRLKNRNAPPKSREGGGDPPRLVYPANYDWKAQEDVITAWKQVHDRFHEALPELIKNSRSEEFSTPVENGDDGAWRNWSQGQVCDYIIRYNIEVYTLPSRHIHLGDFFARFGDKKQHELEVWWRDRKEKSFVELQLECVDWQIANFDGTPRETIRFGELDPKFLAEELEKLRKLQSRLKKTQLPVIRRPFPTDFISFPHR